MLAVQEYLKTKTFEELTAELGIVVVRHETLPLVILNYNQIESPKSHPVVRDCRALVLHADNKEIVARSFTRFFNWGEMADEMPLFDFTDFVVHTKEDGSLALIYFHDGEWHANTRGSFAHGKLQEGIGVDLTWREGMCKALGVESLQELDAELDRSITYVCEFVSPWNKVVRYYKEPKMYLLAAFREGKEIPWVEVDKLANHRFLRPDRHHFTSIEEIQAYLFQQSSVDATFEGVVICDKDGRRWKIKNPTYLALHRLRGEGNNLFAPKYLLPFIMSGESEELLVYFPEVKDALESAKVKVDEAYASLIPLWMENRHIVDQKEFALKVQKHPFSSLLFRVRKEHGAEGDIKAEWNKSTDLILKKLF